VLTARFLDDYRSGSRLSLDNSLWSLWSARPQGL